VLFRSLLHFGIHGITLVYLNRAASAIQFLHFFTGEATLDA